MADGKTVEMQTVQVQGAGSGGAPPSTDAKLETETKNQRYLRICIDYVLFYTLFAGILVMAFLIWFFSVLFLSKGPWWQLLWYITIVFSVYTVVVVLFYILWFFRGPCKKVDGCKPRLKRIFYTPWGIAFTVIVIFLWAWSIPVCMFVYNYRADGNENVNIMRLGQVSENSFSVFARTPNAASLQLRYRQSNTNGPWLFTPVINKPDSTFKVTGLLPLTRYDFHVLKGTETTASADFTSALTTAPVPGTHTDYTFAWGSCWNSNQQVGPIKFPAFQDPYNSWDKLAQFNPAFMLFIGDFTYVDHPYYIGQSEGDYEIRYRQAMMEESFQRHAKRIPQYYMYDDHEITDNWDAHDYLLTGGKEVCFTTGRCFNSTTMYRSAMSQYIRFLGNTNPPPPVPPQNDPSPILYFDFMYADSAFFVTDNRGFRSHNSAAYLDPQKNFFGAVQLQAIFDWLVRVNNTAVFKFIVVPGVVTNFINPSELDWGTLSNPQTATSNPKDDGGSGDDGYSIAYTEREHLLDYIINGSFVNTHFLSGDLHIPFIAKIRAGIYEFSSSPFGGFVSQFDGFKPDSPWTLANPDVELEWYSADGIAYFGNPAQWTSTIAVRSSTRPASFTVTYYKRGSVVPTYTKTVNETM